VVVAGRRPSPRVVKIDLGSGSKGGVAVLHLYWLLYIGSGLATIGCVPIVKRLARSIGALDEPTEERQIHSQSVPRLGGVAVFVPAFATGLLGIYLLSEAGIQQSKPGLIGLFVASTAVFILESATTCSSCGRRQS